MLDLLKAAKDAVSEALYEAEDAAEPDFDVIDALQDAIESIEAALTSYRVEA